MTPPRRIDAKKRTKRLPRKIYPTPLERRYARTLQDWFGKAVVEAYAEVVAAVPTYFKNDSADHMDAMKGMEALLERARKKLKASLDVARFNKFLEGHADNVEAWSKKEFSKQAKAALGVDLLTNNPQFETRAKSFIKENVALIQDLSNAASERIERVVFTSAQSGRLSKDVAADIAQAEQIEYRHAKLIARDQTSKLYGKLSQDRAQAAGLTEYYWRTSNDGAVRASHAALNGLLFRYDTPPEPGNPGEDYQCRCHDEPNFATLLQ